MATDLIWPHEVFRSKNMQWSLSAAAYQGGRPFSGGAPQAVAFTGGGLWRAKLIDIALRTRDQINAWHAFEALLTGGATTIIVPRCDRRHGPMPPNIEGGVPHSDGSSFGDGSLYYAPGIIAYVAEDADLRATTLKIAMEGNRPLIGGEHFSIDHGGDVSWRLYRVVRVLNVSGGGVNTVEIRPPLRKAVDENDVVDFRLPRCVMRLADPEGMALTVEMLRRASPTVEFVETF